MTNAIYHSLDHDCFVTCHNCGKQYNTGPDPDSNYVNNGNGEYVFLCLQCLRKGYEKYKANAAIYEAGYKVMEKKAREIELEYNPPWQISEDRINIGVFHAAISIRMAGEAAMGDIPVLKELGK